MLRLPIVRTVLVAMLAVVAAIPVMQSSAAIACQELPIIEPDPNMAIPMIHLELPRTLEDAFSRGQLADRENAIELNDNDAGAVHSAAQNQFRCLGYGQDVMFAGNSTPEMRVIMFAVPDVQSDTEYIAIESLHVEHLGDTMALEDGRFLIDFGAIVDGSRYVLGELVFVDHEGILYLDGGVIIEAIDLNDEAITIEMSETFTREVKMLEVVNGDHIYFENTEREASADIAVVTSDGETIFNGAVMAIDMVGGENRDVFVVHNLEAGEYTITISFSPGGIEYNVMLVVTGGANATPPATPAN